MYSETPYSLQTHEILETKGIEVVLKARFLLIAQR
jgi:hypothetical protein